MKLRTKFAIVLLVITILLSGATYGGLELYKQQQISDTQQSVNETADLTASQIETTIFRYRDDVGQFADPLPRAEEVTAAQVDGYLSNTRFAAAQVIATNGTVLMVRGDVTEEYKQSRTGSDRSDEEVFTVALSGQTYMGEPSKATQNYWVSISAPITTGDGQILGVVVAALPLDDTTIFQMISPLETSTQSLLIRDGEAVLNSPERTFDHSIEGSEELDRGWTVEVSRDASGLTSDLQNLAIAQGVGLGIVLLLVIAFGYWQYVTNLRQTERLLAAFQELGQGNFEYSVSLGAGEEWEQISDGFNDLSLGLKEREERLRERQQRLEVLYRVLRHNLRNEMSIVQNYADIISDMSSEETIREAADTILDAGEDLIGLSEKARQIENALQDASTEPTAVDAAGVVEEVLAEMREEYPDVDVRSSVPETAWAKAIPSLRMAVENVCENACKHNDADEPTVEVSVTSASETVATPQPAAATDGGVATTEDGETTLEAGDGEVEIEVADNGPGIPEQDRNVLREGRETALEHGSGLGLWLVYWIVDKSGGTLAFDENEPRGSVVSIELDSSAPPDPDEDDAEETADGPGSSDDTKDGADGAAADSA